jgi:hypothetical protein
MAWQWRKSKTFLGGLFRLLGVSVGVPGFRLSFSPDGKRRRTISVSGTGLRKTEVVK